MEQLINSLVQCEDIRQDLWLDYLTGIDLSLLVFKAYQHKLKYNIQTMRNYSLDSLLHNPPKEEFLENFTNSEKELMYLFALGYNIGEVCVHLGINQVGIKQLLSTIRSKEAWDKIWLLKDLLPSKNGTD